MKMCRNRVVKDKRYDKCNEYVDFSRCCMKTTKTAKTGKIDSDSDEYFFSIAINFFHNKIGLLLKIFLFEKIKNSKEC